MVVSESGEERRLLLRCDHLQQRNDVLAAFVAHEQFVDQKKVWAKWRDNALERATNPRDNDTKAANVELFRQAMQNNVAFVVRQAEAYAKGQEALVNLHPPSLEDLRPQTAATSVERDTLNKLRGSLRPSQRR